MGHRAGAGIGGLTGQVRRSDVESSAKVTGNGAIGERGKKIFPLPSPHLAKV